MTCIGIRAARVVVAALAICSGVGCSPENAPLASGYHDVTAQAWSADYRYHASEQEVARNTIGGLQHDALTAGGAAVIDLDGDERLDLALSLGDTIVILRNES